MADLVEVIQYEPGIYQLERTDLVDAGVDGDGIANRQGSQLANRTAWLKQEVEGLDGRVTDLENLPVPRLISLSQVATITAAFLETYNSDTLFSELAISTRSLDPTPFYFTPVSLTDVLNFYHG